MDKIHNQKIYEINIPFYKSIYNYESMNLSPTYINDSLRISGLRVSVLEVDAGEEVEGGVTHSTSKKDIKIKFKQINNSKLKNENC